MFTITVSCHAFTFEHIRGNNYNITTKLGYIKFVGNSTLNYTDEQGLYTAEELIKFIEHDISIDLIENDQTYEAIVLTIPPPFYSVGESVIIRLNGEYLPEVELLLHEVQILNKKVDELEYYKYISADENLIKIYVDHERIFPDNSELSSALVRIFDETYNLRCEKNKVTGGLLVNTIEVPSFKELLCILLNLNYEIVDMNLHCANTFGESNYPDIIMGDGFVANHVNTVLYKFTLRRNLKFVKSGRCKKYKLCRMKICGYPIYSATHNINIGGTDRYVNLNIVPINDE